VQGKQDTRDLVANTAAMYAQSKSITEAVSEQGVQVLRVVRVLGLLRGRKMHLRQAALAGRTRAAV